MKAYGGGGILPFILDFNNTWADWSASRHGCFIPGQTVPSQFQYEPGSASGPVWTLWR